VVKVRISAIIAVRGINPFVRVSAEHAQRLKADWLRPLPVVLRIAKLPQHCWTTNLMPAEMGVSTSIFMDLFAGPQRQVSAIASKWNCNSTPPIGVGPLIPCQSGFATPSGEHPAP
jgi:hypothetical protein